ncbi:MAG TPA: molybdopterin-synthase adenylyltransferase MoeB [Bellilinea sp.]|nr:molybdopterin-synthase adenylyltransferase MoeB [Bellilinea sp.]
MQNTKKLTDDERGRYLRHLNLPGVGEEGQLKLRDASVLVVGVGGLGSPAALYLAAAGVGHLGILDMDEVDSSNLQRQVIHTETWVGLSKVESAAKRLRELNSFIQVTSIHAEFTPETAKVVAEPYSILVDGTDNQATRYTINDYCVQAGKPYVYGSIYQFSGQVSVFDATKGPCYRCLYPEPAPEGTQLPSRSAGVFGVLPGTIGTLEATETIKLILGLGIPLIGKLLLYDLRTMKFQNIGIVKDPECKVCGKND